MKRISKLQDNFTIESNDECPEESNGLINDSVNNIPQGTIMASFNYLFNKRW